MATSNAASQLCYKQVAICTRCRQDLMMICICIRVWKELPSPRQSWRKGRSVESVGCSRMTCQPTSPGSIVCNSVLSIGEDSWCVFIYDVTQAAQSIGGSRDRFFALACQTRCVTESLTKNGTSSEPCRQTRRPVDKRRRPALRLVPQHLWLCEAHSRGTGVGSEGGSAGLPEVMVRQLLYTRTWHL